MIGLQGYALLLSLLGLFLTGGAYLLLQYAALSFDINWEFISRSFLMKWHGALAVVSLIAIGSFLETHIRKFIPHKKKRTTGLMTLVSLIVLITTGYFLYYAGSKQFRELSSILHSLSGLALALLLIIHKKKR